MMEVVLWTMALSGACSISLLLARFFDQQDLSPVSRGSPEVEHSTDREDLTIGRARPPDSTD